MWCGRNGCSGRESRFLDREIQHLPLTLANFYLLFQRPGTSELQLRHPVCSLYPLRILNKNNMANDDVIMSDGEIRSPVRADSKLRGGERKHHHSRSASRELRREERERRRSRSRSSSRGRRGYSRSPERRRSRHRSPRRMSPERRRRPEGDDRWRPRDRSPTTRDRPLTTERTTSSAPQVVSATQRHLSSSEHHRKIKSYDDEGEEVVFVSSPPKPKSKPKQQRMRETFDEYDSHRNKRQKSLETPKVDILRHQPVLPFADQSTEGFMDLEDVLSSLPKPTTIKPRKSVSFATQDTSPDMTMDQRIHPDRMRRLSDDAEMDVDDNDITTSDTFEAPKAPSSAPEVSCNTLYLLFTTPL